MKMEATFGWPLFFCGSETARQKGSEKVTRVRKGHKGHKGQKWAKRLETARQRDTARQ